MGQYDPDSTSTPSPSTFSIRHSTLTCKTDFVNYGKYVPLYLCNFLWSTKFINITNLELGSWSCLLDLKRLFQQEWRGDLSGWSSCIQASHTISHWFQSLTHFSRAYAHSWSYLSKDHVKLTLWLRKFDIGIFSICALLL